MKKYAQGRSGGLDADGMTLREMFWGQPSIYHAPLFQRRYVWGKKQFDQLWEDVDAVVDEVVASRFLGAVVLKNISTGIPGRPSEYLIVDGQQRLATLFILLVAMTDLAVGIPGGGVVAEDIAKNSLVNSVPHARGVPKIAPTLHDRAQFHAIVSRLNSITTVVPATPHGPLVGPMLQMYDRARTKVRTEMQLVAREALGDGLDSAESQLQFLTLLHGVILERLKFVGITLGEDDDPHQVFDRLNSGGIKLKVSDLVRNEVFRRLTDKPVEAEALSNGEWRELEESLFDRFEDFVFVYGLINQPTTTKGALLEDLRGRWGDFSPGEPWSAHKILSDMRAYVPSFMAVAGPETMQLDVAIAQLSMGFRRQLRRLRAMPLPSSVYSYATMVVKEAAEGRLTTADGEACLRTVESFLVRRAFAGLEPTGLHAVFKAMWNEAKGSPSALLAAIERRKTVRFPSDEDFTGDVLRRPVYRMRLLGFVLRAYDESLPGDDVLPATPLTADHVMPQTLGTGWAIEKVDHDRLVDTWANLIPLSARLNSGKSNLPWEEVRKGLRSESAWKTPRHVADEWRNWGIDQIEARSHLLATWAVQRWPRELG